jgi:hypothetical protein
MKGKTMTEPTEIKLRLPDKNTPGFLRRVREINALVQGGSLVDWWEGLGNYVIEHGYVEVPAGVDPHDAIGDLSLADMQNIASALMGRTVDGDIVTTVDPQNGA